MRRRYRTSAVRRSLTLVALVTVAASPAAGQQIDTGTPPFDNGSANPLGRSGPTQYVSAAQTFTHTAALPPLLTHFQFWVSEQIQFATLPYRAYIYAWDNGTSRPTGSYLYRSDVRTGTSVVAPAVAETFATGGLMLTPGQTYAAILSAVESPTPTTRTLGGVRVSTGWTADTYAGGAAYVRFSSAAGGIGELTSAAWARAGGVTTGGDYAFTATFANATPSTVPEPSTIVLVGAGLLGLLARSRRRAGAASR